MKNNKDFNIIYIIVIIIIFIMLFSCDSSSNNNNTNGRTIYIENDDGTYEQVEVPEQDIIDPYESSRGW